MTSENSTIWCAPANIALVKYWGKQGDQLPQNPSVSMTLSRSVTTTVMKWTRVTGPPVHSFLFDGQPEPLFERKVFSYIDKIIKILPYLSNFNLDISSSNNFPHSSGISSSASFMSSMVLCLLRAEEKISGKPADPLEFYRNASTLARLGSGSAARSVFGGFNVWGATGAVAGSSNEFAININDRVHPIFKTYRDAILIVSSGVKSLSSSAGHGLMESNPYAAERYKSAGENTHKLIGILKSGNQEEFMRIIEEEAMTLHGLIQASSGGPILMEPGTISIIRRIREYRSHTGSSLCFTLDAGPNIHLLYPEDEAGEIRRFIEGSLLQYCENSNWIDDRIGDGCKEKPRV